LLLLLLLITPYHMCSPSLVFNVWFGLVYFLQKNGCTVVMLVIAFRLRLNFNEAMWILDFINSVFVEVSITCAFTVLVISIRYTYSN
jgi:hypothetical protein